MTIVEAAAKLRARQVSAVELVNESLAAVARDQPRTNAFIRVDADGALRSARALDDEIAQGIDRGLLHGIPISLKDLIDVAGTVTTAASRALNDRIAPADAEIVTRLRRAGAIFIGKTNLHEFALGTTSEDSAFGPVRNPRDVTRSAGGSSGGSAAAVASGMGLASIGTDTGGSIRIPAAACGVVGLKPSFGEVPTAGIIPLSESFDHAGPLATSVADAAIAWAALTERDPRGTLAEIQAETKRPALVRLRGHFDAPVAPDVREPFDRALAALARAGCRIRDAEVPSARGILEAYVNVVLAEGAAWHSPLLAARGADYTPIVRARFESGRNISAVAYLEARQFCARLAAELDAALGDADAIVLPTLPIAAPLLGSDEIDVDGSPASRMPVRTAMLKHTQPFNMTGHPAISLPIPGSRLPAGLQIAGRRNATLALLAHAGACEKIMAHA
jgi:aspartyl-tRNA(Asn)/glutamyl-tRNA(Gln) amidotransferase subunit A